MDLAVNDSLLANNKWIWSIKYGSGLNQNNDHIREMTWEFYFRALFLYSIVIPLRQKHLLNVPGDNHSILRACCVFWGKSPGTLLTLIFLFSFLPILGEILETLISFLAENSQLRCQNRELPWDAVDIPATILHDSWDRSGQFVWWAIYK